MQKAFYNLKQLIIQTKHYIGLLETSMVSKSAHIKNKAKQNEENRNKNKNDSDSDFVC